MIRQAESEPKQTDVLIKKYSKFLKKHYIYTETRGEITNSLFMSCLQGIFKIWCFEARED